MKIVTLTVYRVYFGERMTHVAAAHAREALEIFATRWPRENPSRMEALGPCLVEEKQ